MPKYDLSTVTCTRTPEEIVAMAKSIEGTGVLGEFAPALFEYLPYEHAKSFLKEGVTSEQWEDARGEGNDAKLRNQFQHYAEWWKEKIENERAISVWRAKGQFALRMWLAGMSEWEEIFHTDGGYYTRDAYETARELCGLAELEA